MNYVTNNFRYKEMYVVMTSDKGKWKKKIIMMINRTKQQHTFHLYPQRKKTKYQLL